METRDKSMKAVSSGGLMRAPHIVMFAHNRQDVGVIKRINAFRASNTEYTLFSFRRDDAEVPAEPAAGGVENDLGQISHRRFHERFILYGRALVKLAAHRDRLRAADAIYARNLDIFLLAWLTMRLADPLGRRAKGRLIYESLDIHDSLTANGLMAVLLRWIERRILRRSNLLIVSSPGFISGYFKPVQHFSGEWLLLENKLVSHVQVLPRTLNEKRQHRRAGIPELTIVWPGIIRCQKTLSLLLGVARAEPRRVKIRIHGRVSRFLITDFEDQIADLPNLSFSGPYSWPEGLATAYENADLVWAQDFEVEGANSDWLLPNRLYEGGYFGVPALAVEGTQTAKTVTDRALGYVLPDRSVSSVSKFLDSFDWDLHQRLRQGLLARPNSDFVSSLLDDTQFVEACIGDKS